MQSNLNILNVVLIGVLIVAALAVHAQDDYQPAESVVLLVP